jgi:hypothetical protein
MPPEESTALSRLSPKSGERRAGGCYPISLSSTRRTVWLNEVAKPSKTV